MESCSGGLASKDAQTYAVVRRPGLRGKKPSTIYTGPKLTFTDRRLENGVKYRYTVTAYDEAGNGTAKMLLARPKSVTTRARTTPTRSKPDRVDAGAEGAGSRRPRVGTAASHLDDGDEGDLLQPSALP